MGFASKQAPITEKYRGPPMMLVKPAVLFIFNFFFTTFSTLSVLWTPCKFVLHFRSTQLFIGHKLFVCFMMPALEGHHKSSYAHRMSKMHFSYFWDPLGRCLGIIARLCAVKLNDSPLPQMFISKCTKFRSKLFQTLMIITECHCLQQLSTDKL